MNAEDQGRDAAEQYRLDHHLGIQPLGDLVALIDLVEAVDVAVIRAPVEDAHGITVRDPRTGAVMLVATVTPHPMRLRSTIAHELAHHLFDDATPQGSDWAARPHEERRADAFARHLLLPIAALAPVVGEPGSRTIAESDVSALVQRFALSPRMVTIQLRLAGYIGEEQKTQWRGLSAPGLATRYGWSNLYGVWKADSEAVRPPQRLLARAIDGYAQGLVSLETIARLQETDPVAAEVALAAAGITVRPLTASPVDLLPPPGLSEEALAAFDAEFGDDA